ncbi:indole-3-glycerol phosphate synthase TrpC [Myroides sp. LoEW2-1]|uniref:indole-3-glycerol phosphate synthase TrpC n=1 Tax=Myroides sp. LoEW2-1 TaxID=2683192 RepID=UPI001328313E|nr:indole-3-glycerol phosphate synthase TrpC [Myroides sp. LoEW2-1]MVX34712.1 indole-3-glycerol phosphate synthase TrpC [Myroides sp. LoEW2-1]
MKNILDTIKAQKKREVEHRKALITELELQNRPLFHREGISLVDKIKREHTPHIIAEFKRQSPSKGIIRPNADLLNITTGYQREGASAISVLNDSQFFGAQSDDFSTARVTLNVPLLQKDFIVDKYQITEAKSLGADVILLIAKLLPPEVIKQLTDYAHQLGLEVLLETHSETEIREHLSTEFDLIGINNRDLNTFSVDIDNSVALSQLLPNKAIKIAESGIDNASTISKLYQQGFSAFLIGEYFMRAPEPAIKLRETKQALAL